MFRHARFFFLLSLLLLLSAPACADTPAPDRSETAPTAAPNGEQTAGATPRPVSPTPLPTTLTARPDAALDLSDFPPDGALVLHFNQPMAAGGNVPLAISPRLTGRYRWNADRTTLTFTPHRRFNPGSTYTISPAPALRSASGLALAEGTAWDLTIQTTARLERRPPPRTLTTQRTPAFTLRFTRAMDRASVAEALSVTPSVPLESAWAGNTLTVTVKAPLSFDTDYVFVLDDGARDSRGRPLDRVYSWEVALRPVLAGSSWPTLHNHRAPVSLRFNYPVDRSSLRLEINPAVDGALSWNADSTVATFTPTDRLPNDTAFAVAVAEGLRDAGGHALPGPEPLYFTTPPAILVYRPLHDGADPTRPVELTFDRPMDPSATEAAFQIAPAVSGTFEWRETSLFFRPADGFLAENTDYTVTVSPDARSATGDVVLTRAFSWSFRTGRFTNAADFGFGPNAQVVDAAGRRAVHFQARSRDQVTLSFELYRLTREQFLTRYASNFRGVAGWGDEPLPDLSTAGTERVAAWLTETADPRQGRLDVQETIIPADVPAGFYILNLSAGRLNDQLMVVLTDYTLVVKEADGRLVAWVTDINGDAAPGVEVSVYARSGDLLRSGVSDEQGIFRTAIPPFEEGGPPAVEPLLIVAGRDANVTVSGLSPEWRSNGYYGWWAPRPAAPTSAVYLFTDRPIYQPGQDVFFKAVVRRDDDAVLSLFPVGTEVTVRLRDARDNVVQTRTLTTGDFGTVEGRFAVAQGAMLGTYHVEVAVGDDVHRQPFKVEAYRKPDYEVTVTTDAARYVLGGEIAVTVDTRYYFGRPVADAEVTIRRYEVSEDWAHPGQMVWYEMYGSNDLRLRGRTDASGVFTATIPVDQTQYLNDQPDWRSSLRCAAWGIEATVDDGSRQSVSGHAVVAIFDAAEWIDLDVQGYLHTPGEPFDLDVVLRSIDDRPVSGRSLTVSLKRWRAATGSYETVVQETSITTGAGGAATLPSTIAEPGYYRLHVTGRDAAGRPIGAESWIYAFSRAGDGWHGRPAGNFTVEADRETYAPGDVARLVVESTVDGPALLTVERGTTRREELVQLTAPVTLLELPIRPDDVPNVYVTISQWHPQSTVPDVETYESLPDSRLLRASVNLDVPAADKILNVTVTADRDEYAPGEEAIFTVRVTNRAGVPVSAEVALGMVDEAIYALSPDLAGPIYDGFYFRRSLLVRTYDSMTPTRSMWAGGMGGGGGGGLVGAGPRRDFPDTAAWFPALRTDFNGEATVRVVLPDNLTTWRLTARATTVDTQVGETTATVLVSKEVIVRPLLPRVLTAGDTVGLSAMVHNYGTESRTFRVTMTGEPAALLRFTGEREQVVTVPAGGQRIVGWPAEATAAGVISLTVAATPLTGAGPADAVALPLRIQPLAVPEVSTAVGQIAGEFAVTVEIPAGALPSSSVELQLSRSIAGSLLEGLEYLTGFPYGCVEQTMSRALPNAMVGRALNRLGVTNPTLTAELPAQIDASIQRLYGYQHDDGGWGWWYDDPSHDYQTAWVLFGLAQIAEAGYEIDAGVMERGAGWLARELPAMDPRTRAFALYALAEADLPEADATLALFEERSTLNGDEFALAALALALNELGETGRAPIVLDEIAATAVIAGGQIHWTGAETDGYYYKKTMASDVRTTALVLSAFSRIRPGHELEAGMVQWLMSRRRVAGWGTTNETSFTILGLTDHLLAAGFNEAAATTPYAVRLNGAVVAQGALGPGAPAVSVTIPRVDLADGANALTVTHGGDRPLYYTLNRRLYLPDSALDATGRIGVTRTYVDAESGAPLESFVDGRLVRVELRVDLPEAGMYMIVEDRLPGGLEALNENLNTTSHAASAYETFEYSWRARGYNYKEVHADRVSFFITEMSAGQTTFTYLARATRTGRFTAMPAEAYAMYDLALWGRSATRVITIAPDGDARGSGDRAGAGNCGSASHAVCGETGHDPLLPPAAARVETGRVARASWAPGPHRIRMATFLIWV